ncbi:glycosyltransferase [Actinokineospora globicatena]|uniref:glycosyltransferase n=1 Tax=Actinokineospora globicatena TaxID=103729 RepID=UPI0020A4FB90|nr:glycosyltransferase [Actinokineospora globicatena]
MPSRHVYVRHLGDPSGSDAVVRLDDPRPCRAPSGSQQWWPPVMLDPRWVREHHGEFDVFHIHFGFDAQEPKALRELVTALREHGKPLVYTVHDLRNPHHRDTRAHQEQLDVLVPAADAVITLTPGAARVIESTWDRTATVLPHPHVLVTPPPVRTRSGDDGFLVGLHAKSLRPNMAVVPVLEVLARTIRELPGARLRVDVHNDVIDPSGYWHCPETVSYLRAAHDDGRLDLRVHDCFTDDELWAYLSELDLSVLPYRFGTHSGWLEACYDLGTTVATSTCGFYPEQRPCLTYRHDESGLDEAALAAAVEYCYRERPLWQADPGVRSRERRELAKVHRALYEDVLSRCNRCASR